MEEASGGGRRRLRASTRASTRASESEARAREERTTAQAAGAEERPDTHTSDNRSVAGERNEEGAMEVNVGDGEPPRVVTAAGTTGTSVGSSTGGDMQEHAEAAQLGTRGRSSARKNKQVGPAPPRSTKRKVEPTKQRVGHMRDEEDDALGSEDDVKRTKRRKISSATKQPPWTDGEVKKLQEVMAEGIKYGRENQDSYDEYNKQIAKEHPSWPRRTHNACRGALKRAREGGDKTFKWSEEEVSVAATLHHLKKSAREIRDPLNSKFGKSRRVRSVRAVKEKLLMLPPPQEQGSISTSTDRAAIQDAAKPDQSKRSILTSSRPSWTPEEDKIVREGFKVVPVNFRAIKAALDRHRETQGKIAEERSLQAVRTRVQVLKSGRKINYQRRTTWGDAQDQLVKAVVKKKYTRARAIQYLVRRTGAMRTFIRHRLVLIQREMRSSTVEETSASQPDTQVDADEDNADPKEAEDLRPGRPDAWQESDYYPSDTSGDEDNSDEAMPKPAEIQGAEGWSLSTPSLSESERRSGATVA
jgi:hypothetical protein